MRGKFGAVGCFMEHGGKILLLHRQRDRPQGNKWGAVVGKIDEGESCVQAMLREMWEETGYSAEEELIFLGEFDGIPMYKLDLGELPEIRLREREHQAFMWVEPKECFFMEDTVDGMSEFLKAAGYID